MRKCKTCPADLAGYSHRARFCRDCIQDRRRKRSREHMAARRIRKVRKCTDCQADISTRPNAARYCRACSYARFLRGRQAANEKYRHTRPHFVYCPEDQPFAAWLDKLLFQRPMLPPVLDHEPDPWQPFTVPDYLKQQ